MRFSLKSLFFYVTIVSVIMFVGLKLYGRHKFSSRQEYSASRLNGGYTDQPQLLEAVNQATHQLQMSNLVLAYLYVPNQDYNRPFLAIDWVCDSPTEIAVEIFLEDGTSKFVPLSQEDIIRNSLDAQKGITFRADIQIEFAKKFQVDLLVAKKIRLIDKWSQPCSPIIEITRKQMN